MAWGRPPGQQSEIPLTPHRRQWASSSSQNESNSPPALTTDIPPSPVFHPPYASLPAPPNFQMAPSDPSFFSFARHYRPIAELPTLPPTIRWFGDSDGQAMSEQIRTNPQPNEPQGGVPRLEPVSIEIVPGTPLFDINGVQRSVVTLLTRMRRKTDSRWNPHHVEYHRLKFSNFIIITSGPWNVDDIVFAKNSANQFVIIGNVYASHPDSLRTTTIIDLEDKGSINTYVLTHYSLEFSRLRPENPFGPLFHDAFPERAFPRALLIGETAHLAVVPHFPLDVSEWHGTIIEADYSSIGNQFTIHDAYARAPIDRWRHQLLVAFRKELPYFCAGALLSFENRPIAQLRGLLTVPLQTLRRLPGHTYPFIYSFTPLPFLFDQTILAKNINWEPLFWLDRYPDSSLLLPLDTTAWNICIFCGHARSVEEIDANDCSKCHRVMGLSDANVNQLKRLARAFVNV